MEGCAHSFLQSTADLSISAQKYLWSIFGVNTSSVTVGNITQRPSAFGKPIFAWSDHQFPMNAIGRRIAGLSGAAAVAMAAFSAHRVLMDPSIDERRKKAVDNANKHHFLHTLAILFAPHSRYPLLTVALFTSGILMFCGSCYAYGIWNNDKIRTISPLGGLMFILGWLSFAL